MKGVFVALGLLFGAAVYGQEIQKQINDQVWKPFIAGFTNGDLDMFMNVHSKDLVRSPRDAQKIQTWDEYFTDMSWDIARREQRGRKSEIELHFTERIASATQAIDVGIYKTTSIAANGQRDSFYGRFHVVLRVESGVWKILVDTDSSEGGS